MKPEPYDRQLDDKATEAIKMGKIPFSDNSVKEDNEPREPWVQEWITVFNGKETEALREKIDLILHHALQKEIRSVFVGEILQVLKESIVDLIEDALGGLVNATCPNCDTYIGTDHYIDRTDIANWLDKRGG